MKNKNQKENWEKGIIKDRICLAYFRKWQNCHTGCQWYRENSSCPNGIAKDLIEEICQQEKAKDRQEIIEKIDKIYKKEQGIHNWLDLREKLKEEIKKENYEC